MNRLELVAQVIVRSPLLGIIAAVIVGCIVVGTARALWEWLR